MIKVPVTDNYVMPTFQTVNKNPEQTELILMDPETSSLYLLHQYYCTDSEDYQELIALLETQAVQGVESPYVLNPLVYLPIKYTNEDFQTSHFVQVLYEYGSHTLEQELYLRIQEKNYFEEHEIWSILGSIVLGMKNLKEKEFTHSSICMSDIFVTKEGQIKICHPMFRTYDHKNSQQVEQNYFERAINENYYFAPEQLPISIQTQNQSTSKHFRRHSSASNQSTYQHFSNQQIPSAEMTLEGMFKSDIFSAGMTVLSLCLLYPVNNCYTKRVTNKSDQIYVQSDRLGQYFTALEQMYSQDLIEILFSMVAYSTQERISVDELASIIEQMIQAKQLQEEQNEHFRTENNQIHENSQKPQSDNESHTKNSRIKKPQNDQVALAEEKFGKFSRVSQASPISGRKTPRSNPHAYGAPLQIPQSDPEDRPSIQSVQCQVDIPNIDVEEPNNLSQSQARIDYQCEQSDNEEPLKQQTDPHFYQPSQSIDHTLKQYINQEASSLLEVNQTKTFEQNQRKANQQKNLNSPPYVQSVMTSKELCSLPSDSTSFVVEKHVISKDWIGQSKEIPQKGHFISILNQAKLIQSKQMQSQRKIASDETTKNRQDTFSNYLQQHQEFSSREMKSRSPNNLKNFLNTIKELNNEAPKTSHVFNQFPLTNNLSARTFDEHSKQNSQIKANQGTHQPILNKNETINLNNGSTKSEVNFSLNKEYETLMQMQKKNPSNLYTDPEFLRAIREDVNKILNKRKLNVTSNTHTQLAISPLNQIFINGKKVESSPKHTELFSNFITPISYFSKPTLTNNISEFR